MPLDACPFEGESQSAVDIFSWNEFIAFNWPALQTCMPDPKKSILNIKLGNQGPVVWQTQMSSDDVFVASGQSPGAWCNGKSIAALFAKQPIELPHPAQLAAAPQTLDHLASVISQPTDVEAVGGVVTDQAGRWLRYQRLMNQPELNAIVGQQMVPAQRAQFDQDADAADRLDRIQGGMENPQRPGNQKRPLLHHPGHRLQHAARHQESRPQSGDARARRPAPHSQDADAGRLLLVDLRAGR